MKLVEIAGHLIDPGMVSYMGPVDIRSGNTGRSFFSVVVDSWEVDWNFDGIPDAVAARESLIAAVESAQAERPISGWLPCCLSWPKHQPNEKGEYLWGECWPDSVTKDVDASDAPVGVEMLPKDASDAFLGIDSTLARVGRSVEPEIPPSWYPTMRAICTFDDKETG